MVHDGQISGLLLGAQLTEECITSDELDLGQQRVLLERLALLDLPARRPAAVVADAEGVWNAVPPSVRVLSAVGSGDALTAGFVWAWQRGETLPEALRLGIGAGTANVLSESAGFLESTQVFNLASRTLLTRLA